jgi:hypothetical protein
MKVYIAEQGVYDPALLGVYATPELAMADNPLPKILPHGYQANPQSGIVERGGGWKKCLDDDSWWNGLDGGFCCTITEYEVISELPASAPFNAV